ncbi:HIT family protein [Giardia lamblia P15]|uniref:HIT family protein n=1 Tax=Giardia intestinalis (strain P15) TaxID=658858 RepID=E1F2T9_GIAIA|nr:HIT family protein [Giardia lamblia P15]
MCIFCSIVAREIPSEAVYEDEHVLAFLDIMPSAPGHCVVIPKYHAALFHELPPVSAAALGTALVKVSGALIKAMECSCYNIVNNNGPDAGQEVPHIHFHIIPRKAGDGLGYKFSPQNGEELSKIAARIRKCIE